MKRIVSGSWDSNGARISFSQTCHFCGYCDGGRGASGRSPQRLPRLAAVEDPDRGVGAAPGAFQAAQEMMLAEARQVEETAPLGVAEGALEIGGLYAGPELVLVDADDPRH